MLRHTLSASLLALAALLSGCDECALDYDCPTTQVCRTGACTQVACTSDRACPPGRRCRKDRCEPTAALPAPPVPDAARLQVVDAGL